MLGIPIWQVYGLTETAAFAPWTIRGRQRTRPRGASHSRIDLLVGGE